MRLENDDPRLMDYVLGELDENEATEVALALEEAENSEANALVEELRGVADTTRRILHEEPEVPALSDAQREAIVEQAEEAEEAPENLVHVHWFRRVMPWVAAAAVITVLATIALPRLTTSMGLVDLEMAELSAPPPSAELMASPKMSETAPEGAYGKPLRKELEVHDLTQTYSTDGDGLPAPEPTPSVRNEVEADLLADSALAIATEENGHPSGNLKNIEVGGAIRIRGNTQDSHKEWALTADENSANVEQRTRLSKNVDFTDDVSTNLEMDAYNNRGSSTPAGPELLYGGNPAPKTSVSIELNEGGGDSLGAPGNGGFDPRDGLLFDGGKNSSADSTAYNFATPAPEEEHWAEYNVGNLTGQQELPSVKSADEVIEFGIAGKDPWVWNYPESPATEIVGGPGSETYVKVAGIKPFLETKLEPLSTFSIDVDTAAYSNVRRFLNRGQMPPEDAVRIEEMINYFAYAYPQPTDHHPFAVALHGAPAPWDKNHRLVRIGVKGKEVASEERPAANLVFLLDVSGSMGDANKLPLVKESMKTLLSQLTPRDKVGIVTYAGDARKVLDLTPCTKSAVILHAIDGLRSGGGTNGGGGIEMAYDMAQAAYDVEGINRVILATDGDFNVGNTSHGGLMGLIEARAKSGVFLTTLGYGMGNLKDSTLEQLADRGNGNYAYIDTHAEARKALSQQLSGTLYTIAKDVKIQVEFNPARVSHYRLLGYENRALANKDFNDDTKDAGEIGAGHTVTALYEIIPRGVSSSPGVDPLKYSETGAPPTDDAQKPETPGEWLTVKMRYKQPTGDESTKLEVPLNTINDELSEADADFQFAASVAAFGQVLRNPNYRHPSNYDRILDLARPATGGDPEKEAFLDMVVTAKTLSPSR